MHAKIVLAQDMVEYSPLFTEIADVYFERAMYAEARPIYETLGADATVCSYIICVIKPAKFSLRQTVFMFLCEQQSVGAILETHKMQLKSLNTVSRV